MYTKAIKTVAFDINIAQKMDRFDNKLYFTVNVKC